MAEKPISRILTAYFVNQYLNTLRNKAADYYKNERYNSMEDAYKNVMYEFTRAFCGQGELYGVIYYNKVVEDFYKKTYVEHINKEDKFLAFIDRTTLEVLPKDYYEVLGSNYKKKEEIVREILRGCLNEFAKYITTEKLNDVLNGKDKKKVVNEMTAKFRSLWDLKINTFVNSVNLPKSDKHDLINNSAELNRKLLAYEKTIRDLKDKLKKKVEEKNSMIRDRNELARRLNQQKLLIREKNDIIAKLRTKKPVESYDLNEINETQTTMVAPPLLQKNDELPPSSPPHGEMPNSPQVSDEDDFEDLIPDD